MFLQPSLAPASLEQVLLQTGGETVSPGNDRAIEHTNSDISFTRQQCKNVTSCARGERLLQTHVLIGQEVQLPRPDWTRATELYILSNQSMRL